MIPNQWYIIAESKEVKNGKLTGLIRMGEKMVLWRDTHRRRRQELIEAAQK